MIAILLYQQMTSPKSKVSYFYCIVNLTGYQIHRLDEFKFDLKFDHRNYNRFDFKYHNINIIVV